MADTTLSVQGMTCATCAGRVESALRRVHGVHSAEVNLATDQARVEHDAPVAELVAAIEDAGFEVPPTTLRLHVSGMTCATCSNRVGAALREAPGVISAQVNLATDVASLAVRAGTSAAPLIAAVEDAGYGAHEAASDAEARQAEADRRAAEGRRELRWLLLSAALTLPLVAPMALMPFGVHAMLPGPVQLALATPVQFVIGARFYKAAWSALKHGSANMDVLVSLGTSAAFALSLLHLHDPHQLWFETSAAVITLVLLGKWLERRARHSTAAAVEALAALRPAKARVERDGERVEIPAEAVSAGERVFLRPGERCPVDGVVREGHSSVDLSMLTGESLPVDVEPGTDLPGGAINGEGALVIEATRVGEDSTIARIIAMVSSAAGSKAPIQRTVDRVTQVFVPGVLLLAAITFVAWWLMGAGWEDATLHAVTVLVIACPCALGLATPAALVAGIGAAAQAGILVRDAEALERATDVHTVVFDKTGTLTEGKPEVHHVHATSGAPDALLQRVAAVQQDSEHPLADAMRRAASELPSLTASEVRSHTGRGVEGEVEGVQVRIGSPVWFTSLGHTLPDEALAELQQEGTAVLVEVDGALAGWIGMRDPIRSTSAEAIQQLHAAGKHVVLLTGDNARTADGVARSLGIDEVIAEVLPSDKAEHIQRLQRSRAGVAMVGDGVNDAPALAAADVGIAMAGGTDVAMATAGITLMRPDPRLVPAALSISVATRRNIRQNLFWAFVYNTVGLPLAAFGVITPIVAGAAMAASSVSVVANALRLRRWRPDL